MIYDFTKIGDVERMYNDYFPKIYNFIYFKVLDVSVADDIVSTTFLKVIEHLHSYDPQKSVFSTWIYSIAKNCVTDYYRARSTYLEISDYEDCLSFTEDFYDADPSLVAKLMGQLKENENKVIEAIYFKGFSNKKAAKILGINESTISTLHQRALKKMLKMLEAENIMKEDLL